MNAARTTELMVGHARVKAVLSQILLAAQKFELRVRYD